MLLPHAAKIPAPGQEFCRYSLATSYSGRMSWFYRTFIRPALFAQDAEEIHHRTLAALGWISRQETPSEALAAFYWAPKLPVEVFGLGFGNPVGLAAGMDKEAAAAPIWPALGFGFSELGGVTWHAQQGNPAPRLFRVVPDEALINRMGLNNPGAEAMARRLAEWRALGRWPNHHPVGINLGKSNITPLEQAPEDYAAAFRILRPFGDFFVVNVSSPNTPNLRQLQDKAALNEILTALQELNRPLPVVGNQRPVIPGIPPLTADHGAGAMSPSRLTSGVSPLASWPKPILVKVAPDLSFEALDEILQLVGPRSIAGIVATNTTITRPASADGDWQRVYAEAGGLSGKPLRARSTEVIHHLYRQTQGQLPIIGVGGIFDAADAWEKITVGASLVQIYTGLVYEGPGIVKAIVRGLRERLREQGLAGLTQAVGIQAGSSRRK